MKKIVPFLLIAFLIVCCKNKKTKLADDDNVSIEDFIEFFPDTQLPFRLADSTVRKKQTDSSLIGYKIFAQFVPDSVLSGQFGKDGRPRIYPLGKVVIKKYETYLFIKASTGAKKGAYVLVFDKDKKFLAAKALLVADNDPSTTQMAEMDNKYTLTLLHQKKAANAEMLYKKDVFVFNSGGAFTLILTESNGMANVNSAIVNPIDTLSRKHKLSGDYRINAKNFVSIRDGRREGTLLFFIHFEKDKGTCIGELKGEAQLSSPNKAVFRQNSGPCVIDFNFSTTKVTIKEAGACGTYRDIKCFFEGSFPKKKVAAQKKPIKKS